MSEITLSVGNKVRFKCGRSGVCCSSGPNVSLTIYDICRISRFLGVDWREIAGKYFYVVIADYMPIPVLRGIDNRCVFLELKNNIPSCKIYRARPMRCRLFPFLPVSPGDPTRVHVSKICPSIGKGPLIDPPWNLLKFYYDEVKKHYRILNELVMEKGLDPLEALEKAIDMACSEDNSASFDLDYLDKLW
ncbi:YkgJ family cysteine cluster protein [Thermogladius sp. 4427co]|uniref:YkgJ family cysteine cluster protein n=1 Tax=Thermogladius sp. 4427co TaxID=3450718 RepID=UPI003F7A352E